MATAGDGSSGDRDCGIFVFVAPALAETGNGNRLHQDVLSSEAIVPTVRAVYWLRPSGPAAYGWPGHYVLHTVGGGGTASTNVLVGPVEPTSWDSWGWVDTEGPNIFGD